jgi:hypothetical protein
LDGQLARSRPGLGAVERLDDGEKNGRLT